MSSIYNKNDSRKKYLSSENELSEVFSDNKICVGLNSSEIISQSPRTSQGELFDIAENWDISHSSINRFYLFSR